MATSNRAAIINKIHKVLKKHYKPITEQTDRSLLENLLYACCLQNASYEKADEAFAAIQRPFFDWNEVRVTTVSELAEVIGELPDPLEAASNIKRTLQSVFESTYSFDLRRPASAALHSSSSWCLSALLIKGSSEIRRPGSSARLCRRRLK